MNDILRVEFGSGSLIEQFYMLKMSAIRNRDVPELWRLTERLLELAVESARSEPPGRWPEGYISDTRLFGVPVDLVRDMPHLLCENYMIYPYTVREPQVFRAH